MALWGLSLVVILVLCWLVDGNGNTGEADPLYRSCVVHCEKTGCLEETCFKPCIILINSTSRDGKWFIQEPLYLRWKEWDCRNECRYHCILKRELERENMGEKPVKYHGRWPFKRVFGIQEPVSVAISALNLAIHFNGWVSFLILVYYKLPLRPEDRATYYEFTELWNIDAFLCMNSWFWSAALHCRDVELLQKLDYSSAVAGLGYTLLLAIFQTFNVRNAATRITVAAPLIAFVVTHILYLNFYKLDHDLHMRVCLGMGVAQILFWTLWARFTCHEARHKLWATLIAFALAMFLETSDFPPFWGYVDARALRHTARVLVVYLRWSFIKDDAVYVTKNLILTPTENVAAKKIE